MQKKILILALVVIILVPMIVGGIFAYQYAKNSQIQTTNIQPTPTPEPVPNPDLKTYTNTQYGFSFDYPAKLNSTFASFQSEPTAIVVPKNSSDIDSKGCYQLDIQRMESVGMVGGINFCESSGRDPGAGQLYSSYYYTVLHGENYITLTYIVHTPNGCGAYQGTPNYQACTDFFNNLNAIVLDPIRNSAATLRFTK